MNAVAELCSTLYNDYYYLNCSACVVKNQINEDKMNGSCSMLVGYMKYVNMLLLRPVGKGHPESHVHR